MKERFVDIVGIYFLGADLAMYSRARRIWGGTGGGVGMAAP